MNFESSQPSRPTTVAAGPDTQATHAAIYRARRERVMAAMHAAGGGVAIVATAAEKTRNADVEYPYRHDSSFYYLSGFTEPDALLVLDARRGTLRSTLFCRSKHPEREVWDGFRHGPEAACSAFDFDAAHAIEESDALLPDLLSNAAAIYYPFEASTELEARVRGWMNAVRAKRRRGIMAPSAYVDLNLTVDEMRLIKDAHELGLMREAGRISADAHRRAMRATRPGVREYELEAELLYEFRRRGASGPAYGSIVAAGINACTLHYPAGNAIAREGDLILIDAACEFGGYAADITRTFPASGRYTTAQRELYDIVLAAQAAAIDAIRVGARYDASHQAATRVLAQGLRDTGILAADRYGSVDDIIAAGAHTRFTIHSTGHWLGMDVHDCGRYRERRDALGDKLRIDTPAEVVPADVVPADVAPDHAPPPWRTLQANMALTVEPGLYVRPADDVPEAYRGIGIRIEDDAVVTESGCELLTRDVPVLADEIEALMRDCQGQ